MSEGKKRGKSQESRARKPEVGSPKPEEGKAIKKSEVGMSKERVKSQEPRIKKSEVSSPKSAEEKPYKSEIENSTFEIKEELQTENRPLQTEEMEVHHHPDLHHEKKAWKEYVLEGLMIFLAVFMGFIAESLRERIGDKERETLYMESLVKDLTLDTTVLSRAAKLKESRMLAIDSVLIYFRANRNANKVPVSTYRQMRRAQWDMFFIHHSGTIDQLKNSGGLRLIRENKIVDSIEHYYQMVQRSESRNIMYFDNQQVSDALTEKFWDAYDNIKYYQDYVFVHKPLPDTGWVAVNTTYLNEYLNNLVRVKWITFSDRVQFTLDLKNNAAHLIALIKKTYQME